MGANPHQAWKMSEIGIDYNTFVKRFPKELAARERSNLNMRTSLYFQGVGGPDRDYTKANFAATRYWLEKMDDFATPRVGSVEDPIQAPA